LLKEKDGKSHYDFSLKIVRQLSEREEIMNLSKMKLSMKLALCFALTTVFVICLAVIGIGQLTSIKDRMDQVTNEDVPNLQMAYDVINQLNVISVAGRNILLSKDQEFSKKEMARVQKARAAYEADLEKLSKKLKSEKDLQKLKEIYAMRSQLKKLNTSALELGMASKHEELSNLLARELEPLQHKLMGVVEDLARSQDEKMDDSVKIVENSYKASLLLLSIMGIIAVLAAIGSAFLLLRSIVTPINRTISNLSDSASQVAVASAQVADASQFLAEGTQNQAASVEETSSSLEEMSSMTKTNADNAHHANTIIVGSRQNMQNANTAMSELIQSMSKISSASQETQKIIKTIDEIAFQTNLLALNAAVEAARAGDAGAGFAVVADEVRNLAMRAAEAARNTAGLIEDTVDRIKGGTELVNKTNEAFSKAAQDSEKIGYIIDEIVAATKEQAQGIEQINTAVSAVDKVIQQNAAHAEESASASEQMKSQAQQMKTFVQELTAIVNGSSDNNTRLEPQKVTVSPNPRQKVSPVKKISDPQIEHKKNPLKMTEALDQAFPDAEKIIPMKDAENEF
jgi:methyl-accepting chemotaxis protein